MDPKRLFAVALLSGCAAHAAAQNYPTQPIAIVVPAAPGGPSDVLARLLAENLSAGLGVGGVVENRGGANGVIGVGSVTRARPDGHTTLLSVDGPITTIPALLPDMPYDAIKDLQPVGIIGDGGDVVLAVPADSPAQSARELADMLRAQPDKANYVSSGAGFPSHIVAELYQREGEFFAQHIPMRGAGAAMAELLSGRMSFSFPPASLAVVQERAGAIRILAVAAAERNELLPNVPTFAESGFPGIQPPGYWIATYVPAGTPQPVVQKLAAATHQAVSTEQFTRVLKSQGLVPSDMTPEQIVQRVRDETAYWRKLIMELEIKPE